MTRPALINLNPDKYNIKDCVTIDLWLNKIDAMGVAILSMIHPLEYL